MPGDPFYTSRRWQTVRGRALRRDKFLCQECKRYGRKRQATTVHHIQHRDAHPELQYQLDNLVSLCDACHNKAHPERGGGHQ